MYVHANCVLNFDFKRFAVRSHWVSILKKNYNELCVTYYSIFHLAEHSSMLILPRLDFDSH